jgi:DNA polymerase epsilon subunit 2
MDDEMRQVLKAFKTRGLTLQADAGRSLIKILNEQEDFEQSLSEVVKELKKRIERGDITSSVISLEIIQGMVDYLTLDDTDIAMQSTQAIDAFKMHRLEFDENAKTFKITLPPEPKPLTTSEDDDPVPDVYAPAQARARMYRERLLFIQQRLVKSGFAMRGIRSRTGDAATAVTELSTVQSLLGSSGEHLLLGYLVQTQVDVWQIEDLTDIIKVDLMTVSPASDVLYMEGSIVLVLGTLQSGIFKASVIASPPAMPRHDQLRTMGIVDAFGTGVRHEQLEQMAELEDKSSDIFILISDVCLDKPKVLDRLEKVFQGFENWDVVPLFVLVGNFVHTTVFMENGRNIIIEAFTKLANLIGSFPRLSQEAKFVLVPGPNDPLMGGILPRKRVPEFFCQVILT